MTRPQSRPRRDGPKGEVINRVSTRQMLADCSEALVIPEERGGPGYSRLERRAIERMKMQLSMSGDLDLDDKRLVRELWDKI